MVQDRPLRHIIKTLPPGAIVFRTDYPQYHSEFVGNVLSDMVSEGELIKVAQGIYLMPRISRFGIVKPSVFQIAESIAKRDNAEILPTGDTALNELGLSTQVPTSYTFLTTGSARKIDLDGHTIIFKRSVPRNFAYKTKLMAYIVQALKTLGQKNVSPNTLSVLATLIDKEPDKEALAADLGLTPVWMRKLLKPLVIKNDEKVLD